MPHDNGGEADQVMVPMVVGMTVVDARQAGHRAGLVVVSADVDGPPLGALTWPWDLDRYYSAAICGNPAALLGQRCDRVP
jgi:hypothetical protein